jgi:hypothetical protein
MLPVPQVVIRYLSVDRSDRTRDSASVRSRFSGKKIDAN